MIDLLEAYDAWRREGLQVGRAVVIRTIGSAPRGEGATLLVAADGRLIGSVSGGCVEGAAAEEVRRAQGTGLSRVIRYGITDQQAWDVGLACGGTIDVLIEPTISEGAVLAARRSTGDPSGVRGFAVITPLPAAEGSIPAATKVLEIEPAAADPADDSAAAPVAAGEATLRQAARDAVARGRSSVVEVGDRSYFVEALPPRPRLVVVGATEVARRLVGLAGDLGYATVVVDARAAFATAERFPSVDRLIDGWPDEAFEEIVLGPNDAVAVLSHDPKLDEPAIVEAVRRGARYVGAVGSRKTQAARREGLAAAGLTPEQIDRIRGPIGLDLGGREPMETALAIMAEIVANRHRGTGAPLRDRVRGAP